MIINLFYNIIEKSFKSMIIVLVSLENKSKNLAAE
jgi:hypothetical protein